jgi:hypothetical protein
LINDDNLIRILAGLELKPLDLKIEMINKFITGIEKSLDSDMEL